MAPRPRGRPKGSKNRITVPSRTDSVKSNKKTERLALIKDIWAKIQIQYPKGGFLLETELGQTLKGNKYEFAGTE